MRTPQSDELVSKIKLLLNDAAFNKQPIDDRKADELVNRTHRIIDQVEDLADGREHGEHRGRF